MEHRPLRTVSFSSSSSFLLGQKLPRGEVKKESSFSPASSAHLLKLLSVTWVAEKLHKTFPFLKPETDKLSKVIFFLLLFLSTQIKKASFSYISVTFSPLQRGRRALLPPPSLPFAFPNAFSLSSSQEKRSFQRAGGRQFIKTRNGISNPKEFNFAFLVWFVGGGGGRKEEEERKNNKHGGWKRVPSASHNGMRLGFASAYQFFYQYVSKLWSVLSARTFCNSIYRPRCLI